MPNIIIPRHNPYFYKPSDEHVEVDYGHSLSKGLVGAWVFNGKNTRRAYNIVDERVANVSGANFTNSQRGEVLNLGTSKYASLPSRYFQTVENWSIAWLFRFSAYSQNDRILEKKNSFADTAGFTIDTEADGWIHFWASVAALSAINIDTSWVIGKWYSIVLTWRVSDFEAWSNGKYKGVSSAGLAMTTNSQPVILSGYSSPSPGSNWFRGDFSYLYTWKRKLNNEEAVALHYNPYQFILPIRRKTYFIIGSSSQSATATPSTVNASIIVNTATASTTVTQSSQAEVSLAPIRVIVNTATATTGINVIATPSTALVTVSTGTAVATTSSSQSSTATPSICLVTVSVGTATATSQSSQSSTATPSVVLVTISVGTAVATTGGNRIATPALVETSIIVNSPTVTIRNSAFVTATTCIVSVSVGQVSITTGSGATATPSLAQVMLTVNNPSISVKANRVVSPSTVSIRLQVLDATAGASVGIGLSTRINLKSKMDKLILNKSEMEKYVYLQSELN